MELTPIVLVKIKSLPENKGTLIIVVPIIKNSHRSPMNNIQATKGSLLYHDKNLQTRCLKCIRYCRTHAQLAVTLAGYEQPP